MRTYLLSAVSAVLVFVSVCADADDSSIKTPRAAIYAREVQVDDPALAACDWNAILVAALIEHAKGKVETTAGDQTAGKYLRVEAIKMTARNIPEKRKNLITVRADVFDAGKLVATMDFGRDDTVKAATPFCESLRGLGSDLGEDVAEWLTGLRLPECRGTCTGLHPDEPIMVLPEVQPVHADSINDTVRGCGWLTYMVEKVARQYNGAEPRPRANVNVSASGATGPAGRRLVLRVDSAHVVGGGGFTGPKWLNMQGQLMDGEWMVGSFDATQRESSARMTACGALEQLSDNMAERIARWLVAPTIASKLD